MRILFWSELYWPNIGGVEVLGARLVAALQSRGHEVLVVTSLGDNGLPEEDEYQGVPIRRFPFRQALAEGRVEQVVHTRRRIEQLKRSWQPDIIHANSVGPSLLFHLATAAACPASLLVTMQQEILPDEPAGPDSIMGRVLRGADWVTCVSAELLRQVNDRVPETRGRSSVVFNVVELPCRQPAPLPFDPPCLLCLGRLVPQKGFDVALTAWAQVRAHLPHARLVIAGDGASRRGLEQQAAKLKLGESVEFLGWVQPEQVPELFSESTLVLMPSRREGLPVVAVQAATLARPIIGTRTTGITEVVHDGQTGLLIDKEDHAALAHSIVHLLKHPDLAQRMGSAARRRALEAFDWQRTVAAYNHLYRQLSQETTHATATVPAA